MFLHVADGRVEIDEPENFCVFKVVVEGSATEVGQARHLLAPIADLADPSTAWVSADALRHWPKLRDDQTWQSGLTAMIEMARPQGAIDPVTGAIKAPVEWTKISGRASADAEELLPDALKLAMRRWGSAVTIITSNEDGVPHGMTATAATSLALDPPSLVICINKTASIHAPILRTGVFCVNLLGLENHALCADFSGRKIGQERFSMGSWSLSKTEPPSLLDAQANIFCKVEEKLGYGTHTLFVGRVTRVHTAKDVRPLLYQNAAYGQFTPLAAAG